MTVTVITGASRGIGRAIAVNLKDLDHTFSLLSSKDVDFEDYNKVFEKIFSLLINIPASNQINLILCAAQIGTFNKLDTREIEKLFKINVLGNLSVIKAVMFMFNVKLRIVWFAGGGAAFPYPEFFGYSLTKTAIVRAVENLSITLKEYSDDFSIIALAPGAVETDMLKTVLAAGCQVRTRTDISEPVNFVRKFITDEIDSKALNGMFLHVRDDLSKINSKPDIFKLRRIE